MMMDTETVIALLSLFGPVTVISGFVAAVLHTTKNADHDDD